MTKTLILFIAFINLISCSGADKNTNRKKENLRITVEVIPEGDSSYSINWKDTVVEYAGYNLNNRPFEVWCFIMDKSDTIGYYRGISTPTNFTYFSTTDTVVKAVFMIGPNIFSEHRDNVTGRDPEAAVEFNPVTLNLNIGLRKSIEFVLIEKRKILLKTPG